jgi:hypothetical protein
MVQWLAARRSVLLSYYLLSVTFKASTATTMNAEAQRETANSLYSFLSTETLVRMFLVTQHRERKTYRTVLYLLCWFSLWLFRESWKK